jgi:hypothetical protein
MLKLKIKCTRFENIYSYNTHNNNDWLKAIMKKNKMKLKFD